MKSLIESVRATLAEKAEEKLDEGRMKELHGYIEKGMSAKDIAKKMRLDVKTIQALMPKKESVAESVVSFVKKNKEPLLIGVIAYFILKKVTGVEILP